MTSYISWKKMWDVIYAVEFEDADSTVAMDKLVKILRSAHGTIKVEKNKLVFMEQYDLMDYKWSTSVIGSTEQRYQTEKAQQVIERIEEERSVIKWLLGYVNMRFDGFDEIYLKIFFDRNFSDFNTQKIKVKYGINNRRYYAKMETSEYLVKRAWCLLSPPQQ
ncbi:hypothetical protein, partial [Anaerorhabdus sp.]|uniref:hypothetical protein n=1 Tax=Anaerorhabdus sp. TaxID=1872524 RepID=UPI002FC73123